jgi:glutamate racemase
MGPRVTLVDSAAETAREVETTLAARQLLTTSTAAPNLHFVASDSPLRFREVGRRFLGELVRDVEHFDVEGFQSAA